MMRTTVWTVRLGAFLLTGCGAVAGGDEGDSAGGAGDARELVVEDLDWQCAMSLASDREDLFRRKIRVQLQPGTYALDPPEAVPFSLLVRGDGRAVMPGTVAVEVLAGELRPSQTGDLVLEESEAHRTLDYRLPFIVEPPLDTTWDGSAPDLRVRISEETGAVEDEGTFTLSREANAVASVAQTLAPCDLPPFGWGTITTTITTTEGTVEFSYSAVPFRASGEILGYAFEVDTYEDLEAQAPAVAVAPGWAVRFPTPGPDGSCGLWVRDPGGDGPVATLVDCDNQDMGNLEVVSIVHE